jgi:hypothetical protein
MLRSLGPGLLRFGGASADTRTAYAEPALPRPAWASGTFGAADLASVARLARRSGWRVLLTVGLVHYEPRRAAREAAAAKRTLGESLAAIEIGNEPDTYAHHHFRRHWSFRRYAAEVAAYRRAIAGAAPGIPLAGPGVSGSHAFARWGRAEARVDRPGLLTGHHYPLSCRSARTPTVARLLSRRTRLLERQSLARFLAVARASGRRLRLDETNTVSCGGRPGVSDTFGAALWAIRYLTEAMSLGVAGVNLQGNPSNCHGYSPLCAASPADLRQGALAPQPEWYALLLARRLIGERPIASSLRAPSSANLTATAFLGAHGALSVVLVDAGRPGSPRAHVVVRLPRKNKTNVRAELLALTAPSPTSTTGTKLAGRTVRPDGAYEPPATLPEVPLRHGKLDLVLPPSSAALLTVSSPPTDNAVRTAPATR